MRSDDDPIKIPQWIFALGAVLSSAGLVGATIRSVRLDAPWAGIGWILVMLLFNGIFAIGSLLLVRSRSFLPFIVTATAVTLGLYGCAVAVESDDGPCYEWDGNEVACKP